MARTINRLSARGVASLTLPGRYADGGNLYLSISNNGGKRWTFKYSLRGKGHELGLGSAKTVTLARARELAAIYRQYLAEDRDPRDIRRRAAVPYFGEFADEFVKRMSSEWRNQKHVAQWAMTLTRYAHPIRSRPIDEIETDDVLSVLKPIWQEKPETAGRVRGRIERVLDAAKARGLRSGENPARWRGHLDSLLPKRQRLSRGHHSALPYAELPALMAQLRATNSTSARALEFLIHTAARTGEVLNAEWIEVVEGKDLWIIPANRMKAGKEHRVPLSQRALAIIREMRELRDGNFIFPGGKKGAPLSNTSLTMALRRLGGGSVTVHGFRSSFRDWTAECTDVPSQIAEQSLAHVVGNDVERAYRRGDALEKRRSLMEAWARYLSPAKNADA